MDNEEFDKRKYENIIEGYSDSQLIFEQAILDKKESNLYSMKKALKEEFRKRLEDKK